ncbi:MAG: Ulp1 family isopeptidase [Oligoflexales bacterium]
MAQSYGSTTFKFLILLNILLLSYACRSKAPASKKQTNNQEITDPKTNSLELTGLQEPSGWLESEDIERYSNYLEYNNHKSQGKSGFKAYTQSAYGHPFGQQHLTEELRLEIQRHWIEGSANSSYFIDNGLESSRIHYFPVNLSVTSEGGGVHWTGIIVDTQSRKVEYYDSFGSNPPVEIKQRMDVIQSEFSKLTGENYKTEVVKVRHQRDGFNCGVYALEYAELRAKGLSSNEIQRAHIDISSVRTNKSNAIYKHDGKHKSFGGFIGRNTASASTRLKHQHVKNAILLGDYDFAKELKTKALNSFLNPGEKLIDYEKMSNYIKKEVSSDFKVGVLIDKEEFVELTRKYYLGTGADKALSFERGVRPYSKANFRVDYPNPNVLKRPLFTTFDRVLGIGSLGIITALTVNAIYHSKKEKKDSSE